MAYKSFFGFIIIILAIFGFLNWPYWQANFFPGFALEIKSAPGKTLFQKQTFLLDIPAVNVQAPIIFPESNHENLIQEALQNGVVHYFGTALPGEVGNVYLAGHSSDFVWAKGDYKTVFARLPKLKIGDEIKIASRAKTFIYRVIGTRIVSPQDMSVLDQPTDKKLLTLQTSYPLGTAWRRYLVIAELTPTSSPPYPQ